MLPCIMHFSWIGCHAICRTPLYVYSNFEELHKSPGEGFSSWWKSFSWIRLLDCRTEKCGACVLAAQVGRSVLYLLSLVAVSIWSKYDRGQTTKELYLALLQKSSSLCNFFWAEKNSLLLVEAIKKKIVLRELIASIHNSCLAPNLKGVYL